MESCGRFPGSNRFRRLAAWPVKCCLWTSRCPLLQSKCDQCYLKYSLTVVLLQRIFLGIDNKPDNIIFGLKTVINFCHTTRIRNKWAAVWENVWSQKYFSPEKWLYRSKLSSGTVSLQCHEGRWLKIYQRVQRCHLLYISLFHTPYTAQFFFLGKVIQSKNSSACSNS